MIYVIGSGPAGVACAHALLDKGHSVTMLDAGMELEPQRRALIDRMQQTSHERWSEEDLRSIKGNMATSAAGVARKQVFGSEFPYQPADPLLPSESRNVDSCASFARGGFSNVWGAAVLPFLQRDISDWPITIQDLAPHYRAVLTFMGVAAAHDELEHYFPLDGGTHPPLNLSVQAEALLADLRRKASALRSQGVAFGSARVAVRSPHGQNGEGCFYCGLCMYGCPCGHIYNSADTLRQLQSQAGFTYVPNIIVHKLEEHNGQVMIRARHGTNSQALLLSGSHVYLACGVLSSTRILLESLEAFDQAVTLRDSQYFILPLARYRGIAGVTTEKLYTLAQVFLELFDRRVCDRTVHLQVYTYNDLYLGALRKTLGPVYPLLKGFLPRMVSHLLVIQGYLHSNLSPLVDIHLEKGQGDQFSKLILRGRTRTETQRVLQALCRKLFQLKSLLRAVPVPQLLKLGGPGRGFHSGGTLPMALARADWRRIASVGRQGSTGFTWWTPLCFRASRQPRLPSPSWPMLIASHLPTARLKVMSNLPRICAITGTNGYVGSRIRDHFHKEGWQIRELSRRAGIPVRAASSWVPFSLQEGVPPRALEGVDLLIHCAYDRPIRWQDIEAVNVHGTERLFQAAHQAQVTRIIFISSMSAFDGCRSMYGRAKLAMESLTFNRGGTVVRPGLIFGPQSGGMFGKLFGVVGRSRVIPLVGRGKQVLHLAHEHDLCRLLERVAAAPAPSRPIIAAGETGFTFKRILQTIAATHNRYVFLLPIPWRLIWVGLVTLEKIGLARGLRSDSLISLVNQEPHPDFSATRQLGMTFRPFNPQTIQQEVVNGGLRQ